MLAETKRTSQTNNNSTWVCVKHDNEPMINTKTSQEITGGELERKKKKKGVQLAIHVILLIFLVRASLMAVAVSLGNHQCNRTCGNVVIPFPFGIGKGCYMKEGFAVTCNSSSGTLRPYLSSINMEILNISLGGQVLVNNPVITTRCNNFSHHDEGVNLKSTPFNYSEEGNRFVAVACDQFVFMLADDNKSIGGCVSLCNGGESKLYPGCYGGKCCQTVIPPDLKYFGVDVKTLNESREQHCTWAFITEHEGFDHSEAIPKVEKGMKQIPALLDWGVLKGEEDSLENSSGTLCTGSGHCWLDLGLSYVRLCSSSSSYDNGFLYVGCQDGDESCNNPKTYYCAIICMNAPENKNCSTCPDGYAKDGDAKCFLQPTYKKKFPVKVTSASCSAGLFVILLVAFAWLIYKAVKKRNEKQIKLKYFKRNGGLPLQQGVSPGDGIVERTKLFTAKELKNATDNYHRNRILGQGGQGTVFKGMLKDGTVVAIKRSKLVDESKLQQFINEVVILSQIKHRNVVRLFGCCLETEVPLLVYEFFPNGTLFGLLHEPNQELPITWEMRLRIAAEVADALSYCHSAAHLPIYHRDIKSMNILLDEKCRANVSDFGIARSIFPDETHLTTNVQGTFGYLDPEYFRSCHFTDKSDVYSFGVVLVELVIGQKPINSTNSHHKTSLVASFLVSMEENNLFELLDARIAKEGREETITVVAKLAERCLNLSGENRPTMREVSMELERIRLSQQNPGTSYSYMADIFSPREASSSNNNC